MERGLWMRMDSGAFSLTVGQRSIARVSWQEIQISSRFWEVLIYGEKAIDKK
jgi:hypothetical protein